MHSLTEEVVGCWKLEAQYIHRELREADEANLLDEEDMHVFGLRPMTDPLILVCCNSCKKPVKASQYAAHAEICKSLSSITDITPEVALCAGQKKPPRKERKKLQITNCTQVVSVGEPERSKIITTDHSAASNPFLDEQTQRKTSLSMEIKANESRIRTIKTSDTVLQKTTGKPDDCHLQTKGVYVPAPLATKIFYSQRNHRLRSALGHIYHTSSVTEHGHDSVNMQPSDRNKMRPWASTPKYFHHEQSDDHNDISLSKHVPFMVENPDQILAQSSDVLDESTKCLPMHFPDQFPVNNVLVPQRTYGGNLASDVLPNPYLFAGN